MLAPNGTPAALVSLLNREIGVVMGSPDVKERLAMDGAEAAAPNTPEQFRKLIHAEIARWEGIIRKLDLRSR
jgi:tripartite-type tricarboxylate transporter receptor subunit TctC